jgi:hypothetical protein
VNKIELQLRETLQEFMAAGAARDGGKIAATLQRIAELSAQLGDAAPPMLRHYLDRRSYQKALDFLMTDRPESGGPPAAH